MRRSKKRGRAQFGGSSDRLTHKFQVALSAEDMARLGYMETRLQGMSRGQILRVGLAALYSRHFSKTDNSADLDSINNLLQRIAADVHEVQSAINRTLEGE